MASPAVGKGMVLHMSVDDKQVTPVINTMKQQLRDLNATWRANVDAAKAAGDSYEATRAKADGLTRAAEKQKEILDAMNTIMKNTGMRTDDNALAYDKLASSIERAESQYKNLTNQQQVAMTALERQETGIDELNRSIKANEDLTQAQIKALKQQGDEYAANELKVKSLEDKRKDLAEVEQKEQEILNKVTERYGENSRATIEQATQLQNVKNQITDTSQELARYSTRIDENHVKLKETKSAYSSIKEAQDSYITRLRAEGKENEANVADINKLRDAYKSLGEQYKLQTNIMKSEVSGSDGFKKAYIDANKTATEMARVSKQAVETQKEINNMNPYGISKIGGAFNDVAKASEYMQSKVTGAYQYIRRNAATVALSIGVVGGALAKGAQNATELENSYIKTNNLLVTSGEKQAEVTRHVAQMQKDGASFATEYGYSQIKVADGYQELTKRGYTSAQSVGSMKSLMEAARASGDDYSSVVRNTTTALENFNLRSDDTAKMMENTKMVTNQMAFAADMTATDFHSLGKAMEYVGASAYQSGFSLSETASAIGILSNNGLEADKAGTGLRKTISSLQSPTAGAADALNTLGLSTKDFVGLDGKMKSMTDIFSLLHDRTKNMAQSQQADIFHTIFGATGQAAGTILTNNAAALGELNEKVKASADGQGYVHTLAQKNMQTTQARLEQLKAVLEQVGMTIGEAMLPALNKAAKRLAEAFNSEDGKEALRQTAKAIGNITKNLVDLFVFLGNHMNELAFFAKTMAAIWAVDKIGTFISFVKNAVVEMNKLKFATMEFNAVSAFGGMTGGGGSAASGISAIEGATTRAAGGGGAIARTASGAGSFLGSGAGRMAAGAGIAMSLGNLIGMNGSNAGGKLGSTAGGIGGDLGGAALGAAIGSAIVPGIGTAIGGVLGAGAGQILGSKFGEAVGKAAQKSLDYEKPKIHIIKPTKEETTIELTYDNKKIQDATKSLFVDLNKNFEVSFSTDPANIAKTKKTNADLLDQMEQQVNKYYENKEKKSTDDVLNLIKAGVLSRTEGQKIWDKVNADDDKGRAEKKKVLDKMRQDNQDYSDKLAAINNNTQLSDKQRMEATAKLHKEYTDKLVANEMALGASTKGTLKKAADDEASILKQLQDSRGKLDYASLIATKKNADEIYNAAVKPARQQKDDIIKAANEKYKGIIKWAEKEKETGGMSKEQYEEVVKNAKQQKKDTTKAANEQYDNIVKAAKQQHKDVVKEVAEQTTKVTQLGNYQKTGLGTSAKDQKNLLTGLAEDQRSSLEKAMDAQKKAVTKKAKEQKEETTSHAEDQKNGVTRKSDEQRVNAETSADKQKKNVSEFNRVQKDSVLAQSSEQLKGTSESADRQKTALTTKASETHEEIKKGGNSFWSAFKEIASAGLGLWAMPINGGIAAINGLISAFGGSKQTIKPIPTKFATGTGAFSGMRRPILTPTLAMLNDGDDSPETGNQEMLIHPNGQQEMVTGRNVIRHLQPGTEVLNATETRMMQQMMGVTRFADGTGIFGKIWDGIKGAGSWVGKIAGNVWDGMKDGVGKFTKMFEYITDAVTHPIKTLEDKFNPKRSGDMGSFFNEFSDNIGNKLPKEAATGWWSELWSMAKSAGDSGAVGEQGDNYPWKNSRMDSAADPWGYFLRECVSYVANSLKNAGVSSSLFSGLGNGSDWVNAKVPHSRTPKPGMVAVYGPGSEFGNHVAMVRSVKGNTFGGEEYNWGRDGKYHKFSGRRVSGATTFLDFGVSSSSTPDGVEAKTPLQKHIKSQVGGMFDWIQKFIGPINDTSTGVGGDVQSWSNDVKKALSKLGLSTSGDMVSRVLRQIQTESGGNQKAIGGNDGLADGNATGLMQVKPGTFRAYALPGHNNIMNGYDNMLAGLNYAKSRYGSSLSFLGNGHGYANGGLITKHQVAEIGEGNQPEMIIPLDRMKSSRGFELLGRTAVAMAARDGHSDSGLGGGDIEMLMQQNNQLLGQLTQLVGAILGESEKSNEPLGAIAMNKLSRNIINRGVRSAN